jgi:hypothetical protein
MIVRVVVRVAMSLMVRPMIVFLRVCVIVRHLTDLRWRVAIFK